jgi:hypothetical protein
MPTIDVEAQRKAAKRELAKSRRKGDFLTCDAPPAPSMMAINGRAVTMRPPLTEAERKAKADRWWRKSVGPVVMTAEQRALLLEPSPYEADGGHSIGRDPRKLSAADYAAAGLVGMPILKVLRARCIDCCAGQEAEVRKCVSIACPSWPYRMGSNPFRNANLSSEEKARRVERGKALAMARGKSTPIDFIGGNSPEGQAG